MFWRVHAELDLIDLSSSVSRVLAEVQLQSTGLAELRADPARDGREVSVNLSGHPENLNLWVYLSAEVAAGRRIRSPGPDFGISGPRRGVWHRWHGPPFPHDQREATRLALFEHRVDVHDIVDGINQMLGRDPSLHRPPRLSWEKLIRSLENGGVRVTERELIATPLTVELAPQVHAEFDHTE
jgi:hypothetical protein